MDILFAVILAILSLVLIGALCGGIHNHFSNVSLIAPTKGPRLPSNNKFITFDVDCGGLNNIRMQLELLTALAWISDRTLVIPEPKNWYLLGPKPLSIGDVFDLDSLGSQIRLTHYNKVVPKGKPYSPAWGPAKEAYLNPTELKKYENKPIWHFYCDPQNHYRLMASAECYFSKFPKLKEILGTISKAVKFKRRFFERADEDLKKLGLKTGSYNAIHIRNWEGKKPQQKIRTQEEVVKKLNTFDRDLPVLVLSQETLNNQPVGVRESGYKLLRPPARNDRLLDSVVDMVMAAGAKRFIGSPASTYSTGIMILRGQLHKLDPSVNSDIEFISDDIDYSTCNEDSWNFHIIKKSRFQ